MIIQTGPMNPRNAELMSIALYFPVPAHNHHQTRIAEKVEETHAT